MALLDSLTGTTNCAHQPFSVNDILVPSGFSWDVWFLLEFMKSLQAKAPICHPAGPL